MKFGEWVCFS